jgi:Na+-driven multidrug efflux pump
MKSFFSIDKSLFQVSTSQGTLSLFSLLFPILFECVMNMLLGTVHTIVLSGYSDEAVAAVGAANGVLSTTSIFASVIATTIRYLPAILL